MGYGEIRSPFLLQSKCYKKFTQNNSTIDDIHKVYVFESTVDLLSYITLFTAEEDSIYISTRGAHKFKGTQYVLDRCPSISQIFCCSDNDNAGNQMFMDLRQYYSTEQHPVKPLFAPVGKDWNDFLRYKSIAA